MPLSLKKFSFPLFYLLFIAAILESALRIQQAAGPLYDLEFKSFIRDSTVSFELNHKPAPSENYNLDGIQVNSREKGSPVNTAGLKVLFMGDSFMQGYPPDQTIPEFIRDQWLKNGMFNPPSLWNAGYSSYAPLIYIVQAKKLIPSYQPDFIVIDVDESDLVDDFALYKPWIERSKTGEVTAVKPSYANVVKLRGYQTLSRLPLYSLRLLGMWFHKIRLYFVFENYRKSYKGKYYLSALSDSTRRYSFNLAPSFDSSPEAEKRYAPEIESFRADLNELMDALTKLTGDPEKILFVYHPHIYQLVPDSRGFLWRQNVPPLIEEAAKNRGIRFYDASQDLKEKFGSHPEDYYVKNDMHLNENGLRIYAELVGGKIPFKNPFALSQ